MTCCLMVGIAHAPVSRVPDVHLISPVVIIGSPYLLLWRAGNGHLQAQNDLFRLQHALHAVKLTGWIYMVLSENEWSGRRQLRLSPSVSGVYLRRSALGNAFDEHGRQRSPLHARITGDLAALDKLLQRSGWRRGAAGGQDPKLHALFAEEFSAA